MFNVDYESRKITLSRGDTGVVPFRLKGYTLGPTDRVLWTMKNSRQVIVKEGIYTPVDNRFRVEFVNGDTDYLDPGIYTYDARVVIHPVYDEEGRIIDGEAVSTPRLPMEVELLRTVGEI